MWLRRSAALRNTSAPARRGWVSSAERNQKQSPREAQSPSTPEAVTRMRGGRSEGAKNPRDPLQMRKESSFQPKVGHFR